MILDYKKEAMYTRNHDITDPEEQKNVFFKKILTLHKYQTFSPGKLHQTSLLQLLLIRTSFMQLSFYSSSINILILTFYPITTTCY